MNIEQVLEFNKIKEQWISFAQTEAAKEQIRNTIPFLSEAELAARLRETTEARKMLDKMGNPPIPTLDGMRELMSISKKGDCMSATQLEKSWKYLSCSWKI